MGRRLEIGPGPKRIPGFETLNIVKTPVTDHVGDAVERLPFPDATFELVYASHILEHVPWYQTVQALKEWRRVLTPNGWLEVWVPDGLKIAKAFVAAESGGSKDFHKDGWYRLNPRKDPCVWMSGRVFTYGDGKGTLDSPNWHRALFSPRHLQQCFVDAGFVHVQRMDLKEVRAKNHGWINLGVKGQK